MTKTILIIGGTGMLGLPVTNKLKEAGFQVRVLSRHPDLARKKHGDTFEFVYGDVNRLETLKKAMEDCYGIHISLNGGTIAEEQDRIERKGTENAVQAAKSQNIQYITQISGSTVFPENDWFPMIASKLAAEQAIKDSGIPYTIFCCTHFMESLFRYKKDNKLFLVVPNSNKIHWVCADDYANMVTKAWLNNEQHAGKRYFVHGPEAYTIEEAMSIFISEFNPELTITKPPLWILKFIASLQRNQEFKGMLKMMKYFAKVPEMGDPATANLAFGPAKTTLKKWCKMQKEKWH